MKPLRCLALVAALIGASAFAPAAVRGQFTDGNKTGGFHLGMSGVGSTASIGVQGEVAFNDRIAIGGWVDTWSYGQSFTVLGGTTSWSTRYIAIAGTGSYHFPIEGRPKLDPFVGVSLGYYVVTASATGTSGAIYSGSGNRMFVGGQVGGRYFFKENMSALALVGVGSSYLTVGMDFGIG